jgi:flagellar biosynthesis protein FlhG
MIMVTGNPTSDSGGRVSPSAVPGVAAVMPKRARVIAVTSGKGGVGKSNLVANLSLAISRLGKSVLAFDADLGMANLDVIFGVRPKFTLYHVLKGKKDLLDIIITAAPGVKFIAGGSGMAELADLTSKDKNHFIDELKKLERYTDVIVIDTGAGLSTNVISFVRAADEVVLVTTPEPTAMADAYGILKTLAATSEVFPKTSLIINRVRTPEEGTFIARRIAKVAQEFLEVKINYGGYIVDDPAVSKSVRAQKPFLSYAPNSLASVCVCNVVANLFNSKVVMPQRTSATFFDKVVGVFKN